jgi:outer membrane protein OmpA-like peptidoglycan-associated protein
MLKSRWIATALLAFGLGFDLASAQSADPETIVRALMPKPGAQGQITRSFSSGGPKRGIEVEGGEEKEQAPPRIDLYVHFEYDQSALTMSDARLTLDALGKALKDTRLASMKFEIIGHTDARGNDGYNLDLSRRRAEAVRQYLVQFHGVEAARLKAEGKGRSQLKDPARPDDAINRRVEIRTVLDKTS